MHLPVVSNLPIKRLTQATQKAISGSSDTAEGQQGSFFSIKKAT
jgi:hypothetical protein